MQIKKGPFGYYACEKLDTPDRLCAYAEEVIAGNKSDFYLKPSTEYIGSGVLCCFEFSDFIQITDKEFSVSPSQKKLSIRKKEAKLLEQRRRSAGDLFYSFVKFLDNLISPSTIVLDPDMVFTDPEGILLKLCCLPVKSNPNDLCLSSLGAERLERLLSCDFFKTVITDDEKNALVHCVKENNEEMFLKIAGIISGTNEDEYTAADSGDESYPGSTDASHTAKRLSKSEKDLILSCLSALISAGLLISRMYISGFLLFLLSVFILVSVFISQKKNEEKKKRENNKKISKRRSSILFSDKETQITDNTSSEQRSENTSCKFAPLVSGKLSLLSECKDINPQYSIYLDETYIGSDCFLSDIVIDNPLISPLHAVIRKKNESFYLEPSKGSGKTYIEDSPVENGRSYEIKPGQKITVGDVEFRFAVENTVKAGY